MTEKFYPTVFPEDIPEPKFRWPMYEHQDNPKQWSCDGKIHINCYEGRIDIRVYQRDSNLTHEMKIFPETYPNGISLCKMILSEQVEM
jgi:hypothetical protein